MKSWGLENVEEAARIHPGTFFIPTLSERTNLSPGKLVRLHFRLVNGSSDSPRAERMWVEVLERTQTGDGVLYRGVLTNSPAYISDLHRGDQVVFGPEHVARKLVDRSDPEWLECGELKALVSSRVLESGQCVRWAYRQQADNAQDSGWRFFAGDESDDDANDPANVRLCDVYWLVDRDPSLWKIIRSSGDVAFERDSAQDDWRLVEGWRPEDD